MKILCIGDSLALPGHHNTYEDTWYYLLKRAFPEYDFISFFKRALTTDALVTLGGGEGDVDQRPSGADMLESYMPDTVIIQLGIVDCAPRLLRRFEKKILFYLPKILSIWYVDLVKVIRKRDINRTDVPIEKFQKNFENYLDRANSIKTKKVIIIEIAYPDDRMVKKNQGIIYNIEQYNAFINTLQKKYPFVKVVSPLDARNHNESIYEDGYHPNALGHTLIADAIKIILRRE